MADINEELRVLVTAEVDKAIKNLQSVDKQSGATEKLFKSLGSSIAAAFSVKAVVDFASQSVKAYNDQKRAVEVLNSVLESTGATAWTSSTELQEMASSLQKVTNYGDETILSMHQVLLGFRNIKGDNFKEATKAILDMATVMKMDLSSAAQSIGKALDDPIHGMDSLKKQGFNFTEAQKKVIQSFLDAGDAASAQKIILDELNGTFGGAAEAAADSATQIKNAFGDMQEGIGEFLSGFVNNKVGEAIVNGLSFLGEAFGSFHDNIAFLKAIKSEAAYNEWFATLVPEKQIEAATYKINELSAAIIQLKDDSLGPSAREKIVSSLNLRDEDWDRIMEDGEEALEEILNQRLENWQDVLQMLKDIAKTNQDLQEQENKRVEAAAAINKLMLEISKNYEKLGKDDPAIQLKNYEKELDDIKKKREELLKPVKDSDGNIIDTSEALAQLDYVEKKIREKIKSLNDDGKKSWKEFWEDATGISADSFKTGKQAGELYISGLKQSLEDNKELANLLGNDFDFTSAIEDQMSEIEGVITQLLNIPADKINEVYSTADASVQKLIDYYRELNDQKKAFEASDIVKALEDEYEKLLMTDEEIVKAEQDAVIAKLAAVNATDEQIERAKELLGLIQEQKDSQDRNRDSLVTWESVLEEQIGKGIEKLNLFKENVEASNQVITNLGVSLANLGINSVMTGLNELGKALGEGDDAADSMQKALASMAQEILNQLPLLMMQAGLQLIAQGQWAIGLGLIFGGLADQVIAGFVQGKTSGSKANALGGVYGDDSYSAFAKGGTFTNQIVAKPTYFRFAKGSGFGTGLMGEAGPEAIMPLTRGADGSLGVSATGIGGGDVQVNIPVTVYSDEPVEVHDTEDENGQRKIEILVGSMINQHIAGGKADRALKSRYGLKVQGV